jgi:two-component system LytT family sensor kinase
MQQTEFNEIQTKLSLKEAWFATHKKHMPVILGIAGFLALFLLVVHLFAPGVASDEFHLEELIVLLDLILLPTAAVNATFFAQTMASKSFFNSWKGVLIKVLATVLGVMLMSLLLEAIYASWGYEDNDYFMIGDLKASARATNTIEYSLGAFFISIPIFIWQLRIKTLTNKLNKKEIERQRLARLKTQAELHALQSRINPHFLFNSFNSIASLISIDPDKAEKMMVDLSELFRYSLNSEESNYVKVEEELKIVNKYLSIEKIRFGENLDYQINVSPEIHARLIPRFLIQPLVENAIKHAMAKIKKGQIRLLMEEKQDHLEIVLFDNGPAFPEKIVRGYGIQSTYDKLELLYPNTHEIRFANHPEKCISLQIPKKPVYQNEV